MNPTTLSRASDASWRHFAPNSTDTTRFEETLVYVKLDASGVPVLNKKGKQIVIEKKFIIGGPDYLESHPTAEAAKHLFYEYPAKAAWIFSHWLKT